MGAKKVCLEKVARKEVSPKEHPLSANAEDVESARRVDAVAIANCEHWSVNLVGRLLFGTLALLAGASFTLFAGLLLYLGGSAPLAVLAARGAGSALFLVAGVFMLLAALHALCPTRWSHRWLTHFLPRGGAVIILFVAGLAFIIFRAIV